MSIEANGQGPAPIQPQPVPMTWGYQLAQVQGPVGPMTIVVVQIAHQAGTFVAFLEPQAAMEIGGKLRAMGKRAVSGLILPDSVGITTDDEVEL